MNRRQLKEYLSQWVSGEIFPTDFDLMLDRGLYNLALDFIVGAGAIEPVDTESKEILEYYSTISRDTLKDELKYLLTCVEVFVDKYNQHTFIDTQHSHLMEYDLNKGGYTFKNGYDKFSIRYEDKSCLKGYQYE